MEDGYNAALDRHKIGVGQCDVSVQRYGEIGILIGVFVEFHDRLSTILDRTQIPCMPGEA
jgi:hypothetical protein